MYGLNLFASGSGPERFRGLGGLAAEAEAAGFDGVWVSELYNRSATVPMAVAAQRTERVKVGSNIAYGVGRTPLVWAAEARDLDELSGGRLVLGLGNGTPKMMESWHGVSGRRPAARLEELVQVLRKLWRLHEGPVDHDGDFYTVHVRPTTEVAPPFRERLPIWTAGVNTHMLRATGKVADGLIGHPMFTGRYLDEVVRPELAIGAASGGRGLEDVALMGILICAVDEDEEKARGWLAFAIAQYAASRVYDRLFELHGWADAQRVIREAARSGDREALVAAVPDEAIDAIGVACTPGRLAARVAEHAKGYDHLVLTGPPWGLAPEETEAATRTLVGCMRGALSS